MASDAPKRRLAHTAICRAWARALSGASGFSLT